MIIKLFSKICAKFSN